MPLTTLCWSGSGNHLLARSTELSIDDMITLVVPASYISALALHWSANVAKVICDCGYETCAWTCVWTYETRCVGMLCEHGDETCGRPHLVS